VWALHASSRPAEVPSLKSGPRDGIHRPRGPATPSSRDALLESLQD
jgi:hypothetical protein